MKGYQTTDKQPFAVNKPVSFRQITVNGGCSKINKLHTDVIKQEPPLISCPERLRFTANCRQIRETRETAAKKPALHCCRSYSEVVMPCTELLISAQEPGKELGHLHLPLCWRELKPIQYPPQTPGTWPGYLRNDTFGNPGEQGKHISPTWSCYLI